MMAFEKLHIKEEILVQLRHESGMINGLDQGKTRRPILLVKTD